MILEYAQLLSTAHRVLDGKEDIVVSDTGRKKKVWRLDDDRDSNIYSATHINHASAIWARASLSNYMWLSHLLIELCHEYTYRYGKIHKCESSGLTKMLIDRVPNNIPQGKFTQPTPAMPVEYIVKDDSLSSYRNYYIGGKQHLASWQGKVGARSIPEWFL